ERVGVTEQRRDVLEQHAWLRVVGDVADVRGDRGLDVRHRAHRLFFLAPGLRCALPVTRCCLVTGRGGVSPVLAAAGTATPSAASCSAVSSVSWSSGPGCGAVTGTSATVPSAPRWADRLPARR